MDLVCYPDDATLVGGVSSPLVAGQSLSGQPVLRHYQLEALLRLQTVEDTSGAGTFRLLDYDSLVGSVEATGALSSYLSGLSTVDPTLLASPDEQLAYWLNSYNAWVLYAVASRYAEDPNYSVESDGWLIFTTPFIEVGGLQLTPNDLEHGLLRGHPDHVYSSPEVAEQSAIWHQALWGEGPVDGRLHVALNCASWSCPNLPPGALQGEQLDAQLDALSREFLDNTEKGAGPNGISTLFSWFADDFAGSHGSVEDFIATYRTEGLSGVDTSRFLSYDWSLNAASALSEGKASCSPW